MTDEDATRLEDYRFQMGHDAGNLAMALDQLTDALAALNQHAVYYRLEQGQRRSAPPDLAPLAGGHRGREETRAGNAVASEGAGVKGRRPG